MAVHDAELTRFLKRKKHLSKQSAAARGQECLLISIWSLLDYRLVERPTILVEEIFFLFVYVFPFKLGGSDDFCPVLKEGEKQICVVLFTCSGMGAQLIT